MDRSAVENPGATRCIERKCTVRILQRPGEVYRCADAAESSQPGSGEAAPKIQQTVVDREDAVVRPASAQEESGAVSALNRTLVNERLCSDANEPAVDFGRDGALVHHAHIGWSTLATGVANLGAVAAHGDARANSQRRPGIDQAEGI